MFSWLTRKVALSGATGFLGRHIALELCRHGAEVTALVRPSSDLSRLQAAGITCRVASLDANEPKASATVMSLAQCLAGCDIVIHCAGAVGFTSDWRDYRINVEGTRNLLAAARLAGVRRFVHTSSIVAVAASQTPAPCAETSAWNLRGLRVPYVTTKRWAEETALAANGPRLEVVVVNPGSIVGPDDHDGSEFGTLCKRFWRGRIPFHFGGGTNFVDVRDVAQGVRLTAERGRAGERYLLTGENRVYHAFFQDLCRAAGRTIPRLRLPTALAPWIGMINERWRSRPTKRPYLTEGQAALLGLYFFFRADKARTELGFHARPFGQTLADTYAFWRRPAGPLAA